MESFTNQGAGRLESRNELGRGSGDQRLFIGTDDADSHPAVLGRDERGAGGVTVLVQRDPEELQPFADAAAGLRRVLADPSGEDDGIKTTKCRRQRPEPRLRPVAEECNGLGRPDVFVLPGEKVAKVGAGLRDAEQAGFVIDEVMELVNRQPPGPHQVANQAGIDIAAARAHHQPRGRSEAHRRVDASAFADRRKARPGTEVGKDDSTSGCLRAADPGQFLHHVGVGKAMEAVATDPRRLITPRDRYDLGDAREVVMEGGIEARHLRQLRIDAQERLDRPDLAGQVVGVVGDDLAQLLEELGRDELRSEEALTPVYHAMADDGNVLQRDEVSESLDQEVYGRRLIRGLDLAVLLVTTSLGHDEPGSWHPDPLNPTGQEPLGPISRREQRELEARRAAVDRQDVGSVRPLGLRATRAGW